MEFYTSVETIGNSICYRGVLDGKRFKNKVRYSPSYFLNDNTPTDTGFISLYKGDSLRECETDIKDYKQFIKNNNDILEIHGTINPEYQFIGEDYGVDIDFDISKMVIANIDIETEVGDSFPDPMYAAMPLTAITIKIRGDRYYTFGCQEYKSNNPDNMYFKFKDELEMLDAFIRFWEVKSPDIVTGWNITGFDIPYLYNRITNVMSEKDAKRLSPWKKAWPRTVTGKYDKIELNVKLYGVQQLDLLALYQKNILDPRDNYTLDHIGEVEVGKGKVKFEGSLHKLYLTDYQTYITYNIRDVEIVEEIDQKLKLIEFTVLMAYKFGVNFEDVSSPVKCWDTLLYTELKKEGVIIPPKREKQFIRKYAGAYVKEPIKGMRKWAVSYDLSSLYPSLIRQSNVSPETMRKFYDGYHLEGGVERFLNNDIPQEVFSNNCAISCNGQSFTKDFTGIIPKLLEKLGDERKVYKKKMFEYEQMSLEIKEEMKKRGLE